MHEYIPRYQLHPVYVDCSYRRAIRTGTYVWANVYAFGGNKSEIRACHYALYEKMINNSRYFN